MSVDDAKTLQNLEPMQSPIVVVGSGPVGIDFCRKLAQKSDVPIVLFGDENYAPYNRVKLSLYLSGEVVHDDLYYDIADDDAFLGEQITLRLGRRIQKIDTDSQTVVDELGQIQPYSKLILATGASSFVPPVENLDVRGVYTFRDLKDADHLLARLASSRRTVVVGGGLLGLEIAYALNRNGTAVTVVDVNAWVLFRQLNEKASKMVQCYFEKQGIEVLTGQLIKEIVSDQADRLLGFKTAQSETVFECDTLIFATGAKPNTGLAKDAGIAFADGIMVNAFMQTSDECVYAIGDCAEYQNQIHGIVSPGYEQASVAANHVLGLPGEYQGSEFTTVLKVAGIDVFCAGHEAELQRQGVKVYEYEAEGVYRCIFADNNRVVYVIGIGEWDEASRLAESISAGRRYWAMRFFQFAQSGHFFPEQEASVAYWPENAIVCNCMSVSRGTLSQAISEGADSIELVQAKTQACTVCGSCQPKIQSLIEVETGHKAARVSLPYSKPLFLFGLLSLITVLLMWGLPVVPASNTVLEGNYDFLWLDGFYKQVTGFTLLGLSVLAMTVSVSKRYVQSLKRFFNGMRFFHVGLAVLTVSVLLLHTGNSMGEGLNQWLLINYLFIIGFGGLMAFWLSTEHKVVALIATRFRKTFGWAHILAVWALPVLLSFHVLSVYYF